ncbi:hypothetical protein LOTGIDRAFT_135499 [Lottia gigantea]|uniref:Importin N-terminal domain-containing protein n=1 Tax=Lottia gigantea TaxID=225164 RepID=V3YVJ7_LOTGI|nr:hypothetical protein LOTGIDRAFT_135499 [Lottia gigantea]ESO82003.1 hypothetical protein LOTGIDRAFT_135499 [Lottia gigantea]
MFFDCNFQASDENSLRALEALMTEFFDGRTSNERKREIEAVLNNFGQTKESWRHCLYFMANTQNEYVMMFCLSLLENVVNRQWLGISVNDKLELRNTVNQYLLEKHTIVPSYIRNKLIKLVVDIGRIDWPHFYPDFFPSILQLVQQSDTVSLGVMILQTASEELASPREDLSMARKEELNKLLLLQVPTVLGLLNNILESVLEKHHHLVAATPPPSPTHGESESHRKSAIFMFKTSGRGVQLEALPPLDENAKQLCSLCLNCLAHFFSWIPLSSTITPQLLSTIFHFAGFGCEVRNVRASSPSSSASVNAQYLGVLAMNCINELLAKNCVPQEFEDFLVQMFQQTFSLLQKLTKESSSTSSGNRLEESDESYVEKFTDFLQLFVSVHLRRFENNAKFPILEFLALLFKYTFRQPSHEGYYHCLEIWNTFLDYLLTKLGERSSVTDSVIGRYKEALTSLVSHILQKLQFRYNQSQLEELDDESLDDNNETEWQNFLRQSLEVVAKVSELLPAETFQLIWEPFSEAVNIYAELGQFVTNGNQGRRLTITGENECRRLHCTLRDLSSLFQAAGRLAEHFIGEKFSERCSISQGLVERLVSCASIGSTNKLFEVESTAQTVLQPDFIQVHAQALAATKAYSHWLVQFYAQTQKPNETNQPFYNVINTILSSVAPMINKQIPEKVVHSASHLLLSITTTVRPCFLLEIPSMMTLYTASSQGSYIHLSQNVQHLVYRSLSHYLLLPWLNIAESEQDWEKRAALHQNFVNQLSADYLQLKDTRLLAENKTLYNKAIRVIQETLRMLEDWIESIAGEVVKSKKICFQSLQVITHVTLGIFPVYIQQTDVIESIMSFFLALFQGLRVQMGVSFTQQAIQTFMNLFTKEHLAQTIHEESSSAFRVIEKFLKILVLIVQEPGSQFKSFLPQIITISMDQIYPLVAPRPSPDMKCVLYTLLFEIINNNWRYFFKSGVLSTIQKPSEDIENGPQFIAIMQAYGQSFLQPDITIFKQNLESLELLNTKWKLYNKAIFKEMMLFQFLNVLLQTLVVKSHDLLQEEIVITVYNMASVDFEGFYTGFLPQFLNSCDGLDVNQKTLLSQNFKIDKDLPTFTQNVHRLMNDVRYYRQVNNYLPAGSITF